MVCSKIDLSFNKIARVRDLDEFAEVLFPRNSSHQTMFVAIFVELKYAEGSFLPNLEPVCERYGFSKRRLETVRAKMRRMGLIDHVSRLSKRYGYREGWVAFNPVFQNPGTSGGIARGVPETKRRRPGTKGQVSVAGLELFPLP